MSSDGSLQPSAYLFSLSYLSRLPVLFHEPSWMRLFPHVFLIIYTIFHFSALFFSAFPIRQARLSSHPLSTYMRGDAPGISPDAYLSLIPSELVSAKISLSARLARVFLIITSIHKPSPYLAHNGNRHHTVSHQLNRSNVTGRTSW